MEIARSADSQAECDFVGVETKQSTRKRMICLEMQLFYHFCRAQFNFLKFLNDLGGKSCASHWGLCQAAFQAVETAPTQVVNACAGLKYTVMPCHRSWVVGHVSC